MNVFRTSDIFHAFPNQKVTFAVGFFEASHCCRILWSELFLLGSVIDGVNAVEGMWTDFGIVWRSGRQTSLVRRPLSAANPSSYCFLNRMQNRNCWFCNCLYLSQPISSHWVRENSKLFLVSILIFTLMFQFLNYFKILTKMKATQMDA